MAIQFGISSNFNLTTFAGSSFSFKYHFSQKIALRVIGSLSTSVYDIDLDRNYGETEQYSSDQNYNNYTINVKLPIVYYPKPFHNATPYFGLGPLIEYSHRYAKISDTHTSDLDMGPEEERNLWHLGISGMAGAELFVQKNISIHAEYFALLYYRYLKETENRNMKQTTKYNGYYLAGSHIYFGLSVYF